MSFRGARSCCFVVSLLQLAKQIDHEKTRTKPSAYLWGNSAELRSSDRNRWQRLALSPLRGWVHCGGQFPKARRLALGLTLAAAPQLSLYIPLW